ncbi:MAG: hypothetical protein EAZ54_06505 [Curvibacter sp.]|nr:MAG: hypothetical protein EAZ54_06505 [Curvibacter sp.]
MVNTALKFARTGWLKKHALMVHAAVAALNAFAFDMFRHMLYAPCHILKIVQCGPRVHGAYVSPGFAHGPPVVQKVAPAPEDQAREPWRERDAGISAADQCFGGPSGPSLLQERPLSSDAGC